MDDEPLYYLRAGDVVPRDAAYVIIGGSVKVVPDDSFQGCDNLARVELQEGVEEIGGWAFEGCTNLTRVDFPSSLRWIGDHAFTLCQRLSEVFLRDGLRGIERRAFCCSALERITIPSTVVEIGEQAFR